MTFLERLFGEFCSHRFTWPRLSGDGQHYQICLICGTAYGYDWRRMQRTDRLAGNEQATSARSGADSIAGNCPLKIMSRSTAKDSLIELVLLRCPVVPAEFGPKYTSVLANGRSALVRSNTLEANSREGFQPPPSGTLIQGLKGVLPLQAPPSSRG
jgi:hypothetical protein